MDALNQIFWKKKYFAKNNPPEIQGLSYVKQKGSVFSQSLSHCRTDGYTCAVTVLRLIRMFPYLLPYLQILCLFSPVLAFPYSKIESSTTEEFGAEEPRECLLNCRETQIQH